MAFEMREIDIVAKLTGGEMAATDSVYHSKCLVIDTEHFSSQL